MSTNFDNFWQKDGKEAEIMRDALISTSPNLRHHITVLNADVPNCYAVIISIGLLIFASSIQYTASCGLISLRDQTFYTKNSRQQRI